MALDFSWMQSFVISHGYMLIFLIMIFEGPMITTAAAFAASLGYLNIWLIMLLSLLGDVTGDSLHYWIGRSLNREQLHRWGSFLGVDKGTYKLEHQLKNRTTRTFFIVKQVPPLTSAGLIAAGIFRVPYKKFFFYSFIFTLPRMIFFAGLGFFFGVWAAPVLHYFSLGDYWILAMLIIMVVTYVVFRMISKRVKKELEHK